MSTYRKKRLREVDAGEEILTSLNDLFTATLFYTMELAERRLVECSVLQRAALEKKYGTDRQDQLISGLLRDAAKRAGMSLDKFAIERVDTEHLPVPHVLVSFEDLMNDISH